jgi:hypothetical protein
LLARVANAGSVVSIQARDATRSVPPVAAKYVACRANDGTRLINVSDDK